MYDTRTTNSTLPHRVFKVPFAQRPAVLPWRRWCWLWPLAVEAVLALAQQIDYKEHSMYAVIEQLKSIVEAVKRSGRL